MLELLIVFLLLVIIAILLASSNAGMEFIMYGTLILCVVFLALAAIDGGHWLVNHPDEAIKWIMGVIVVVIGLFLLLTGFSVYEGIRYRCEINRKWREEQQKGGTS